MVVDLRKAVHKIMYMLSYAWELDKWYLLLRIPIVIIDSTKPFIMVLFPARIIEDITISLDINAAIKHCNKTHYLDGYVNVIIPNNELLAQYVAYK